MRPSRRSRSCGCVSESVGKTDYTLEEVGKQFAVTRERIRQIEARALRKLRQTGRSRNLAGFMERE